MDGLIFSLIYLSGYALAYIMQRTEIASEKEVYTVGDRLLIYSLSLLSYLWVVVILITAWVKQISKTGYWAKPVQKEVKESITVDKNSIVKTKTTAN